MHHIGLNFHQSKISLIQTKVESVSYFVTGKFYWFYRTSLFLGLNTGWYKFLHSLSFEDKMPILNFLNRLIIHVPHVISDSKYKQMQNKINGFPSLYNILCIILP